MAHAGRLATDVAFGATTALNQVSDVPQGHMPPKLRPDPHGHPTQSRRPARLREQLTGQPITLTADRTRSQNDQSPVPSMPRCPVLAYLSTNQPIAPWSDTAPSKSPSETPWGVKWTPLTNPRQKAGGERAATAPALVRHASKYRFTPTAWPFATRRIRPDRSCSSPCKSGGCSCSASGPTSSMSDSVARQRKASMRRRIRSSDRSGGSANSSADSNALA